jgi:hypothetical protein
VSLSDLGNIGEFLGGLAVIISIIYLAVQVRQNTRAIHSSRYQDATDSVAAFYSLIAQDADVAALFNSGLRDAGSLDETDSRRFAALLNSVFSHFENLHFQNEQGTIDAQLWQRWSRILDWYLEHPGVKTWWSLADLQFADSFRSVVSRRLDTQRNSAAV